MVWLERIGIGLLLAALVLGSSVVALTSPGLTRALVVWSGGANVSELTAKEAVDAAEEARRYVTGATDTLPTSMASRDAFDASSTSHLDDVGKILSLVRALTALCAAALAGWLSYSLAKRRSSAIGSAFSTGAVITLAVVVLAGAAALLDFDRFFAGFHGVLFESGTWTFPSGTLLIELFPERFWAAMAALWGVLGVAGAAVLWAVGHSVGTRLARGEFKDGA